jgi:hypothetical protein
MILGDEPLILEVVLSQLFMKILVVCEYLVGLEWTQKCWSAMGMSGHVSAGPLRACVKVDDCLIHLLQVH